MHTIVIGIGLDDRFLSSDVAFLSGKSSVGEQEIARLVGEGKASGLGPLPVFLRHADDVGGARDHVDVILVTRIRSGRSRPTGDAVTVDDVEIVDTLKPVVRRAALVGVTIDTALWGSIRPVIGGVAGTEASALHARDDLRFLIVGTHTENRVLAMASFLRNVLGVRQVAVSAHLAGSGSREAHFAALRYGLPACGVQVLLGLEETARFAGMDPAPFAAFDCRPCVIGPVEAVERLPAEQRDIVSSLCMHWTRTQLRPLQGGFSGSLLFFADGWRDDARTEPVVLKIDRFAQMRREIDGYHQISDFFGKHMPKFSHPVARGEFVGVAMEFAAMEGRPQTLQVSFERAEDEGGFRRFRDRLDKAMRLLAEKLHDNTSRRAWFTPYRVFGLHSEQQQAYLATNLDRIRADVERSGIDATLNVDPERIRRSFRSITSNEDSLESEVCLVHGDLNYQNVICDQADNVWFIDWTHSGEYPIEQDFAKLENDVKFVMSKQFDESDLPLLREFEAFLLADRMPVPPNLVPDHLRQVKWDLRYRKILETVRLVREICFAIKQDDDWLAYQVALLRYATHTLSFDRQRDRGECDLTQLLHAAYSVDMLTSNLAGSDFHRLIRGARPAAYPPRQRIPFTDAAWSQPCPAYDPPYFVHELVLANDSSAVPGGWADPEDVASAPLDLSSEGHRDDEGRPLNPRGRTGLAGRGLLGHWGANHAAAAVVLRISADQEHVDVLLGTKEQDGRLWLPKGFAHRDEDGAQAIDRILEAETGWRPELRKEHLAHEGYFYDARQTDHAWVEIEAFLAVVDFEEAPRAFRPGGDFETVRWMPVNVDTINRVPSAEARFVRDAIERLQQERRIGASTAAHVLARTG